MSQSNLSTGEWSQKRIGRSADRLFLYCFLSYTCSYLGRKNLSACLPAMMADGLFDITFAGYLTTAYMICYGLGQIVSGILAARIKPKYLIGIGLFGAGLCNLAMSVLPMPPLYPVIWAVNGIFHSMLWSPIIRVFTDLLPAGKSERAGVNIAASCSIGAVLAYLIPALVLKLAGWRIVFVVSGGVLLAAAAVWVVGHIFLRSYIAHMEEVCRLRREELAARAARESMTSAESKKKPKKRSLMAIFMLSGLWLMLVALICNGALRDAVETWAPTFLSDKFGLDESVAALCSVLIPIFSLLGPYVSDSLHKRVFHNEIYTSCALFGVAILCIGGMYVTLEVNALLCAVFMAVSVAAMFGTNHMFLTVIPYHFAPMGLSATISGILNSIIYLATALFSAAYGMIAKGFGWNVLILVWLGVGVGGVVFSIVAGRLWGKRYPLLDEGKL